MFLSVSLSAATIHVWSPSNDMRLLDVRADSVMVGWTGHEYGAIEITVQRLHKGPGYTLHTFAIQVGVHQTHYVHQTGWQT